MSVGFIEIGGGSGVHRLGSARLGWARLGSARLGSARLGSARLGSAGLGSARLGSAQLGSARFWSRRRKWHQWFRSPRSVLHTCNMGSAVINGTMHPHDANSPALDNKPDPNVAAEALTSPQAHCSVSAASIPPSWANHNMPSGKRQSRSPNGKSLRGGCQVGMVSGRVMGRMRR